MAEDDQQTDAKRREIRIHAAERRRLAQLATDHERRLPQGRGGA